MSGVLGWREALAGVGAGVNQRYQRNISCKDGLDRGQKWYRPNRSRGY